MASLTGRNSPLLDGQPVFACYDMLKREIQALLAENEELRKLVDLMKENQQLKTVIRGQAMGGEMQPPTATSSRTSERGHSNVLSPGPTAESQAFHPSSSPLWTDTIEEGTLSMAPLPLASPGSRTSVSQSVSLSEGQISEARARTPDSSNRDSADTSKRYRYIRLPSTFNFRAAADNVSHTSSPWDSTGSDDVFSNDLTVLPQRISSPTARTSPINYRMSASTPETQPPPDVRPKEMTRKIVKAADKAQTQGAGSRANVMRDHRQQTWERIVGEIAFQLDRRILSSIFPERVRLYGFTVNNIPEKIIQASTDVVTNQMDEQQCTAMTRRFLEIMNRLRIIGYDPSMHPPFTEYIVNTYGILRERPDLAAAESSSYNNLEFLRKVVTETVPPTIRNNTLMLLQCLYHLSRDDGKPMFIW